MATPIIQKITNMSSGQSRNIKVKNASTPSMIRASCVIRLVKSLFMIIPFSHFSMSLEVLSPYGKAE